MSSKKETGNPIFDIWLNNQERFLEAQSQWMNIEQNREAKSASEEFINRSLEGWQRCEEQYQSWMQTAQNWTSNTSREQQDGEEDYSAQALNHMLNPATFMQSGFEVMEQVFQKLLNGPEFADIGIMEKKLMKTGKDWQAFRDACHRYQEVISAAWLRSYQHFTDEFVDNFGDEKFKTEELLQRWLKIADEELVATLRSEEFLEAQKELFSTGAAYKLKYRELAEMWCESHTIPTRSEVDDLHKIIYQLRREVRELKRRVEDKGKVSSNSSDKPKAKKSSAKAATKKSRKTSASKTSVKKAATKKAPAKKLSRKKAPAGKSKTK